MKQFLNIFSFELKGHFKNKSFIILNIIFIIVIGVGLSFPRISEMFNMNNDVQQDIKNVAIVDNTNTNANSLKYIFNDYFKNSNLKIIETDIETLKKEVKEKKYNFAIYINNNIEYTYISSSNIMVDQYNSLVDEFMRYKYQVEIMGKNGIDYENAKNIINANIKPHSIYMEEYNINNFIYAYILIFGLYFAILTYGNIVAMSVATEKNSRTMEILITSAKPFNLIFGKIIASGVAGLIQICIILFSSLILYKLNEGYWINNTVIQSIFNMPLYIIFFMITFFILGFFIYSSLFGAVTSFVSKVEDVNIVTLPIVMIFVVTFFIVVSNLQNINSTIMIIASYVPFSSPMAMFTRMVLGDISMIEISISILILIITTILTGIFTAKAYRVGVLMYGNSPKLKTIIKAMRSKY